MSISSVNSTEDESRVDIAWRRVGVAVGRGVLMLILAAAAWPSPAAAALSVRGWLPLSLAGGSPPPELVNDPLYGRQICPSLTRLNLAERRAEDLLVTSVTTTSSEHGTQWTYELRSGLAWWGGAEVTAADLAQYLRRAIPAAAQERGAGLWAVPEHTVAVSGKNTVRVSWTKAPAFGPYIVNSMPFFRTRAQEQGRPSIGYECVGIYVPRYDEQGALIAEPSPAYRSAKSLPTLRFEPPTAAASAPQPAVANGAWLAFRTAASYPLERTRRHEAQLRCEPSVDLPIATLIAWNLERGPTADARFRSVLSQLMPRSAILEAGAGGLGELPTGPIPRRHPGYNARVRGPVFSLEAASEGLSALGFKRKEADEPRLHPDGRPLRLSLALARGAALNLVSKVIGDTFAAVGISVSFVSEGAAEAAAADGRLGLYAIDWPEADYLKDFHSKAAAFAKAPHADAELDAALERYALSLTQRTPEFQSLATVHARLALLQPVTVIMQHRACMTSSASAKPPARSMDPMDPDWFRRLLLDRRLD